MTAQLQLETIVGNFFEVFMFVEYSNTAALRSGDRISSFVKSTLNQKQIYGRTPIKCAKKLPWSLIPLETSKIKPRSMYSKKIC